MALILALILTLILTLSLTAVAEPTEPPKTEEELAAEAAAAWLDDGQEEQQFNEYGVNVFDADLLVGYVAADGAVLNPFFCGEWDLVNLNQLVFESLVTLDGSQKPVPMLADNWTHEGVEWTFTLRTGIQFHNGVELTSDDVKSTYDAFVAAGDNNPYYDRINRFIEDLRVVDSRTVAVTMSVPGYIALYAMTFPIVQTGTIRDELPRGTGPFWYVSYMADSTARIEANPLWWKQAPTLGSITFRHYPDAGTALEGLQTGQVDMISTRSPRAAVFRRLANLTSMDYASTTYDLLVPNMSAASAMSELNVRQAAMYAIDRSTLVAGAYMDMAVQSEVPVQPGTWLYESRSAVFYYSPERALQLLYDAGWKDLTGNLVLNKLEGIHLRDLSVTIMTCNDSTNSIRENAANLIAENLNAIGMKAKVSVVSRDTLRYRLGNGEGYDLALISVHLSEVPLIRQMLINGGTLNYNNFMDMTLDGYGGQTVTVEDEAQLKSLYSQIQLRIVDQLPFMGLLFRSGTLISSRSLGGIEEIRTMDAFNGLEYLVDGG